MSKSLLAVAGLACVACIAGTPQVAQSAVHNVAPGGSVAQALTGAAPGDVIQLAPGNYPKVTLRGGPSAGPRVILRPRGGGAVRFDYLNVHGSNLDIRGVTTRGWYIHEGSRNITMRGVRSTGGTFITSARNVRLIGGSIRGVDSVDGLQIKAATNGVEPANIRMERFAISGVTRNGDPNKHTECIQVTAVKRMLIRDSTFTDCSTQGVFFKEGLGGEIDDVVVENSWFGRLTGYNTLIFDDGVSNMTARHNIFAQAPRLGGGKGTSNIRAIGNTGQLNACGAGVSYRDNHWTRARCGATDSRRGIPFPISSSEPPKWSSIRRVAARSGKGRDVKMRVRRGADVTTFMVRSEGRPTIKVTDPSGKRAHASRKGRGRGYAYVTVRNPQAGGWKLRVANPGSSSSDPVLVTSHR
jgi:hypothetical protein